jgi:hypothetical protein
MAIKMFHNLRNRFAFIALLAIVQISCYNVNTLKQPTWKNIDKRLLSTWYLLHCSLKKHSLLNQELTFASSSMNMKSTHRTQIGDEKSITFCIGGGFWCADGCNLFIDGNEYCSEFSVSDSVYLDTLSKYGKHLSDAFSYTLKNDTLTFVSILSKIADTLYYVKYKQ